jgi:carbonic anhydrase
MSSPTDTEVRPGSSIHSKTSRRLFLAGAGLAAFASGILTRSIVWSRRGDTRDHHGLSPTDPRTAADALARLRAGNECYVQEHFDVGARGRTEDRRQQVASAQHPYAVVLACADSRVGPEVIFSAGLGDLFVVRVAGNIVDARCLGVLGSIEYAIEELKIPLIVVLGHEGCGAVKAAIKAARDGIHPPGAIRVLTDAIRPVLANADVQAGDLLRNAVVGNVNNSLERLRQSNEIVGPAIASKTVQIAGAVYELETGRVRFLADS